MYVAECFSPLARPCGKNVPSFLLSISYPCLIHANVVTFSSREFLIVLHTHILHARVLTPIACILKGCLLLQVKVCRLRSDPPPSPVVRTFSYKLDWRDVPYINAVAWMGQKFKCFYPLLSRDCFSWMIQMPIPNRSEGTANSFSLQDPPCCLQQTIEKLHL